MTQRFEQAVVAFKMGKFQSEFDNASPEDRAYSIMTYRILQQIEAFDSQVAADEMRQR